jgi:YHS domain-containing protein/thiol-disulfide isomerase/thioredoxin
MMKATALWGIWTAVAILALASPVVAQEGLRWESDLPTAQKLARQSNRLVLIHFGGPWCGPCRMLEQNVFSQPGFGSELAADYVAVKVDPNVDRAAAREYGITRVPTDAIATPSGQLIYRIPSPNTASDYVTTMLRVAAQTRPGHQATPPQAALVAAPAPQSADEASYQNPAAARPADDRYADYYNRRQGVQQQDYQPPVQNQVAAAPPGGQQPPQTAEQHAAGQPAEQNPSQDRYADRHADRFANHSSDPAGAGRQNLEPPAQAPQAVGPTNNQPNGGQIDRYASAPGAAAAEQPAGQPQTTEQQRPAEQQASSETANSGADESLQARIPPGSPPLALDGYCAVTLQEKHDWQVGDPKWGAIHRGMLYLFTSQAEQQKFLANPDQFSPMFRGHDPVLALDQNKAVLGRREYGVFCDGRIYLFASEATRNHFERNTKRYCANLRQAMR